MATRHEQVMEMVARELEQNPDIDAGELYTRAAEIDPSIRELDRRQFNARYPLQVKRLRAAARGDGGAAKPAAPRPSRRRKSQAKGKTQASSPFEYAARLTEVMLLGIVSLRAGTKIHYDAANMRVTNVDAANAYLRRDNRPGWTLSE